MSESYPTLEQFKKDMWNLTKLKDPATQYHFVLGLLQRQAFTQEHDYEGNLVDYKLLKNKYLQYYNGWIAKYGSRDPKYIPSKEELVPVSEFIGNNLYLHVFTNQNPKSFYLFGDSDFEQLDKDYEQFCKHIGKAPAKERGDGDGSAVRANTGKGDKGHDPPLHKPENVV
jgi:hypothetical protein